MTKHIAITQVGDKTIFMLGDYQANLYAPTKSRGWLAEYFKKNRTLMVSDSSDHPPMPPKKRGRVLAESIVKKVLTCLDSGDPIPKANPVPTPTKPKRSRIVDRRSLSKRVASAFQVVDRLLNLVDDTCTVMVPMGKPSALANAKVRIVDSEGETICEIPYQLFKNIL